MKINITEEFVSELLESRGWDKAGIRIDEKIKGAGPEVEGAKEVGKSAYDNAKNDPKGITEEQALDFIIENAGEILDILSEAGLIVESVDEDEE